jgi:tol-pal system beta propeller repeat protein TolB
LDGNFEIYLMDINGGNLTQLTDNIGSLYAPEISPKGNRIVFTAEAGGNQAIWIMKLDGSNARPIYDSPGGDIDPTWSPDGSQILFASDQSGETQLYIMNADGSRASPVSVNESKIGGRSDWSPNGFLLGFYAGSTGDHNLFFLEPNGRAEQQITDGGDNLSPSFSPDSQWITFTSYREGNNEIYVMHLGSLETYRLTSNTRSDWQPRWGP